ncbi:peptidoglycan recognition protein 1-like [Fopius arisanus]|uniref:PGLYRP1 protein n=1 Tax=Fopius arisanus TaxID=64838 RepID=A0A0C9R2T5_9HYME|nr:PREDICTED: peptidoglycan recognition protein 1-like [Fopius arisanus]
MSLNLLTVLLIISAASSYELTSNGLKIYHRVQHQSHLIHYPIRRLRLPVSNVLISYTGTGPCYDVHECSLRMTGLRRYHTEINNWPSIGYNFLVGSDGNIYEGCGWDTEVFHASDSPTQYLLIGLIGDRNHVIINGNQLRAVQKLLEWGVHEGKLSRDYRVDGHRQKTEMMNPHDGMYKNVDMIPHWHGQLFTRTFYLLTVAAY